MGRRAAPRLRSRARHDDGAAAVEFGLLLPLFVMLTLGTISAGFAFHAWLNVTHGAQESSRFAATLSIDAGGGTTSAWLTQVGTRAASASNIDSSAAEPGTYVCVSVVSSSNIPPLNNHMTMTASPAGVMEPSAVFSGACPEAGAVAGDFVQTYVSKPVDFNYLLGSAQVTVASKSVSRFEAVSLS